ncbi:hypothetical protein BHM03_00048250 [Ensete ventricosum]|uniref:EXS domain-containing protein n=1 Tax=Ensete ventricosum TaxID=4639 RepID=A0A426YQV8_ENSVE|nr:hypothetical protein B296_00045844 [Ensete ventricosum]RZS16279.1 hypothetical protein BHM03_00048250 [Ensete ventricosum]
MPRLSSSLFVLRAGLFTGSFVTLFVVYAILAHLCGIFSSSSSDEAGYMETVYPIFRFFQQIKAILLQVFTALLFCPFNIFYRSTRYCFLRVMRNIAFSPLYKVN